MHIALLFLVYTGTLSHTTICPLFPSILTQKSFSFGWACTLWIFILNFNATSVSHCNLFQPPVFSSPVNLSFYTIYFLPFWGSSTTLTILLEIISLASSTYHNSLSTFKMLLNHAFALLSMLDTFSFIFFLHSSILKVLYNFK